MKDSLAKLAHLKLAPPMNTRRGDIDRWKEIVRAFPSVTVTALADLVADEFVFGEIARVSREAPVLILRHRERTVVPGGGANAVMNLASLGLKVLPVGVVGEDEPGELLLAKFRETKISTRGILKLKGHITTTKTRILAGSPHSSRQQVVRIDREAAAIGPNRPALAKIANMACRFASQSQALLVSDYGYGAATPQLLSRIKSSGWPKDKPITLDSRYRMLEYTIATAATPNEPEVEEALQIKIGNDDQLLLRAGKQLMSRMGLQSLVITRGRDGMVAFEKGAKPLGIPISGTDQVVDVTGAGDTVIATFTAALAAGASTHDAARLANFAGGIVVMKRGTATVSNAELLSAINQFAQSEDS
jgi:rfaE bifunctional protein kinase chain/domain